MITSAYIYVQLSFILFAISFFLCFIGAVAPFGCWMQHYYIQEVLIGLYQAQLHHGEYDFVTYSKC